MGAFFEKTFMRKNSFGACEAWVDKAAADIGYVKSAEGFGAPVVFRTFKDNIDWMQMESPLLETNDGTAEAFLAALAREFKSAALRITCVDSDFALCRLINGVSGSVSEACINEPYEGFPCPKAEPKEWIAACKKKWNCSEKQFDEVFSGEYVFAEEGLLMLAEAIKLPQAAFDEEPNEEECGELTFWIMPEAEFNAAPVPRTLAERLAAYIDESFAEKLTRLGYKRFNGSSLRWHKVFGGEGKEIVSSIVFVVRYDCDINIFFGSQAVCCPLVISDKYFPLHDHFTYYYDAVYEFPKHMGYDPVWIKPSVHDPINSPEKVFPYLNAFVPELLETVKDIDSLRKFVKKSRDYEFNTSGSAFSYAFAYRMFVEAILAGDERESEKYARKVYNKYKDLFECVPEDRGAENQQIPELPRIFLEKGIPACMEELKKVRGANLRKLKKGGIIE